ncbi:hypothetical protein [Salmonella enterica]|uniref:hypothetical protein n=1 Tax=Salmonella enterica TaxID=28901 RepID=UPI00111A9473|nr:hypothetical protein [Salmonella enterica]
MHEYFSYNFRRVITCDTKCFDIDLDVLNDSGQICFLDVQLFKTCWRTNFFEPLLKCCDAVVCRTESEHNYTGKPASGQKTRRWNGCRYRNYY